MDLYSQATLMNVINFPMSMLQLSKCNLNIWNKGTEQFVGHEPLSIKTFSICFYSSNRNTLSLEISALFRSWDILVTDGQTDSEVLVINILFGMQNIMVHICDTSTSTIYFCFYLQSSDMIICKNPHKTLHPLIPRLQILTYQITHTARAG